MLDDEGDALFMGPSSLASLWGNDGGEGGSSKKRWRVSIIHSRKKYVQMKVLKENRFPYFANKYNFYPSILNMCGWLKSNIFVYMSLYIFIFKQQNKEKNMMSCYRVPLFWQNQFDRVKNCQVIV